jgi:hypothetical protein
LGALQEVQIGKFTFNLWLAQPGPAQHAATLVFAGGEGVTFTHNFKALMIT